MRSVSRRSPGQVLVIYNPASGSVGDLDRRLGAIIRRFGEEGGCLVQVRPTRPGMTAKEMLGPLAGELDRIVAIGGDGTVGSVLGAVAEMNLAVPVGIIPFGTGNLLARSLGICTRGACRDLLENSLDIICAGNAERIDLGKMNGRWFIIDAGTGPISDAITAPKREHKSRWKLLVYGLPLLKSIARRPIPFAVTVDGGQPEIIHASAIFVTNMSEMGIGRSDYEHLKDGVLDLIVLNPKTICDYWAIAWRFASWFLLGRVQGMPPYMVRLIKRATIEVASVSPRPSPLHRFARRIAQAVSGGNSGKVAAPRTRTMAMIDGDPCGTTPMHIEIVPQAVRVFIPARPAGVRAEPAAGRLLEHTSN